VERSAIENRQVALGQYQVNIPLADGVSLDMVKIPGGNFIMGSTDHPDEMPGRNSKWRLSGWDVLK
jgi:hypothetical protein